jgi:hypothetical protein
MDAGTLDHGVEVSVDDEGFLRVATSRGREDVGGLALQVGLGFGENRTATSPCWVLVEGLPVGEAKTDHWDVEGDSQRASQELGAAFLALVEDDDRVVTGGFGVGCLDLEEAGAALDERDAGAGWKSSGSQPEVDATWEGISTSLVGMS